MRRAQAQDKSNKMNAKLAKMTKIVENFGNRELILSMVLTITSF